jgi:hypothetical protein
VGALGVSGAFGTPISPDALGRRGPVVYLDEQGFGAGVLREKYGYAAGTAEQAAEFLHDICLREDIPPEGFLALSTAVEAALMRNAEKSPVALQRDIRKILGGDESGYGAFAFLRKTNPPGILSPKPMRRIPQGDNGIRRLAPVYRSGEWKLPLKRVSPRGFPEALTLPLPSDPAQESAPGELKGRGASTGSKPHSAESPEDEPGFAASAISGGSVSLPAGSESGPEAVSLPSGGFDYPVPTAPLSFPEKGFRAAEAAGNTAGAAGRDLEGMVAELEGASPSPPPGSQRPAPEMYRAWPQASALVPPGSLGDALQTGSLPKEDVSLVSQGALRPAASFPVSRQGENLLFEAAPPWGHPFPAREVPAAAVGLEAVFPAWVSAQSAYPPAPPPLSRNLRAGAVSRLSPAAGILGAAAPSSPPFQQNSAELERLRRIEANYERDKALLARERQPLLARGAACGMERAEETAGAPAESDAFAIQRMNDKFGRLIKEALNESL